MILDKKDLKYCKHCGDTILKEDVVCVKCGLQVEELKVANRIVINNSNVNPNMFGDKTNG